MGNLISIREKIKGMAELTLSMLKTAFDGFIEHDLDTLSRVLKDEQRLNDTEKQITLSLVDISKGRINATDKKNIMLFTNIVADLEQIGDYIKDMVERIEIKIQEKLLFSDEALGEYKHLYNVVETELSDVEKTLRMNDKSFAKRILCNKEHADSLVQKYRDAHARRLISGICEPRACNMFLNLLDFTAQISHHTKTIAKNILSLK
ncbi:MAG: PhoU domain-containing protein [Candidatus Omnitrophota bacterium]